MRRLILFVAFVAIVSPVFAQSAPSDTLADCRIFSVDRQVVIYREPDGLGGCEKAIVTGFEDSDLQFKCISGEKEDDIVCSQTRLTFPQRSSKTCVQRVRPRLRYLEFETLEVWSQEVGSTCPSRPPESVPVLVMGKDILSEITVCVKPGDMCFEENELSEIGRLILKIRFRISQLEADIEKK